MSTEISKEPKKYTDNNKSYNVGNKQMSVRWLFILVYTTGRYVVSWSCISQIYSQIALSILAIGFKKSCNHAEGGGKFPVLSVSAGHTEMRMCYGSS